MRLWWGVWVVTTVGCAASDSLQIAVQAGRWLVDRPAGFDDTLYYGRPGRVLYFLELARVTGEARWRDRAEAIAESMRTSGADPGFYTGSAGLGTVYLELFRQLGRPAYDQRAREIADGLSRREFGPGLDIISGAAGTGLFLLRAAVELDEPRYVQAAVRAGDYLVRCALEDGSELRWPAVHGGKKIYSNFSHGTSGAAFFLAVLYERSKEPRFLSAALKGAAWLVKHRTELGWYHHEPDGTSLYYWGWCHGPAETARLFYQLFRSMRDPVWLERTKDAAEILIKSGVPERSWEGYWNLGQCCGAAGIGDFFCDLYLVFREPRYLQQAHRMARELQDKAVEDRMGVSWIHAENRVSPRDVAAHTGYAQGSAGIGLFFLKFHEAIRGRGVYRLPDNPFDPDR